MSDDILDKVETAAANLPVGSSETEIQAAAGLAKAIAEAQKARADARNQVRQIHLESLKSWSTLLVPIVSLLTLLATIIIQSVQLHSQLESAAHQSEDVQWKDLITSLSKGPFSYASDITVSSQLKTFLKSDRYGEQARDLAIRTMGNLTNFGAFEELFNAAVATGKEPLKAAPQVERALTLTRRILENNCHTQAVAMSMPSDNYFGICQLSLTQADIDKLGKDTKDPNSVYRLRQAYMAVWDEMDFTSRFIAEILRTNRAPSAKQRAADVIDLSYLSLQGADLSGIDFSAVIMTNTVLDYDEMKDAVVTPSKFDGLDLSTTDWWNAKKIDANLLRTLTQNQFPYYGSWIINYPGDTQVAQNYYETRIKELCVPPADYCKEPLPFGKPPDQPQAAPASSPVAPANSGAH